LSQSYTKLYYHFVWSTYHRENLAALEIERPLYRCIIGQVLKLKGTVLALDGMPNHVHLVVQLPSTVAPAFLMQRAKGVSSAYGRDELLPGELFGWQDGYSRFTVSWTHLPKIVAYVRNQKRHHAEGSIVSEWEAADDEEAT
jgi:REP element-mobilizing transposase RayT